ncbi:hypothetical protein WAF85_004850 [Salmonella enterica]|nr:hypothetical protein [Salmonella enterica subsp. enterica serovar Muenchen]
MEIFGTYNTGWYTLKVVYHGGNTNRATLCVDGNSAGDLSLMYCPAISPANTIQVTSITSGNTSVLSWRYSAPPCTGVMRPCR